jgi:aldehyde:ferredoxin oxidoreductase
MAGGYMGKLLDVDLTTGKLKDIPLDEKMCRDLIGGYGIGSRILYDLIPPKCDPLGPQNVLGFFTGPFTGTPALSGSRYVVVCKSPLTNTWGDANSGGTWGPNLKFAGYDGVIVKGKAKKRCISPLRMARRLSMMVHGSGARMLTRPTLL